ncbi:beta-lactamase transpeptidase [Pyrenophora seminiperda CCB06]|uniref:Beta-lactamase transpeptidase n=1 Tax=Pyrenophora seminiperda CCB06 TaxID=1302712 RepID=A0A3M7LYW9_9PLEO|nr:beta-lactamase transpeptidase [Pyrenophora seminiperda CCB06]
MKGIKMVVPIVFVVVLLAPTALSLCPPPGPIFPPPALDSNAFDFSIPDALFSNLTYLEETSFAIQAAIGNTTVFQYEHSAPGRQLNQSLFETKIRIASATKLITALAIELSKDKISLDDPVTKFIPGLNEELYGDVTVKALADHTSGLGRFGYTGDLAYSQGAASLGLPKINNTLPRCDPVPGGRICTTQEVLAEFNNPTYAPYSPNARALYSNIGYILLGRILEAVHNQTYEDVIQKLILGPVGMKKSTFISPSKDDATAILPRRPEDKSWFVDDFGNLNPTGGLWSTPNEMMLLLHALQNNDLLSAVALRDWMKPTTFLSSVNQAVGIAWEIFRITDLPLEFPRAIDIYTKLGGVPGYGSYFVLIPEFDIAITINAAGGAGGATSFVCIDLLGKITAALIPYADQLARKQAASKYAGTYKLATSETNDTITISSTYGPGLSIDSMTINNVAVLPALAASQGTPVENFSARLYPTDPDSLGTDKENWRMLLDQKVPAQKLFGDMECMSWNLGDPLRYVSEPLDTFVFHMDGKKVASVELLGWRVSLVKVN